MTQKQLDNIVESALAKLSEHFMSVQFLGSMRDPDGSTSCYKHGKGDWYSRIGMVREMLVEDEARIHAYHMAKVLNPPDDNEAWKQS